MRQLISLTTSALLLGLLLTQEKAPAQMAGEQFKGSSWRLISGRVERGGKKVRLTAPRLQGFLMFDRLDHFLIVVTRSGQAGTLGQNKAALQKSVACFGTYSINDADHTINVHIESSTFPKWNGTEQKRRFAITGDRLTLTNSSLAGEAEIAELVWGRAG